MKQLITLLLPFLFMPLCHTKQVSSHSYNAIFSFGNSYTDTGNLIILVKNMSPTLPLFIVKYPYGETFFHHPTGRCSNGRLILDFLAEEFGLPYIKPYLAHNGSYLQGANFAVAGATTLDLTQLSQLSYFKKHNFTKIPNLSLNTSLNSQLGWFEELKPSLCKTTKECRNYFGKSLFMVGEIGINDYNLMFINGISPKQARHYASIVIKTISTAIEKLIDQGARTLVVPGDVPMGCLPTILTLFKSNKKDSYDPKAGCLKEYNMLSRYHNTLLRKAINKIRIKYSHAKIIYADFYEPIYNFVKRPKDFGFAAPLRACCGRGGQYNVNINETCGMSGVNVCKNPSNYVNWDGIHLTEAAYHKIADGWLNGPYADPPILSAGTE